MTAHPYADSEFLADLLWEAEMVADKYASGGLILIRTKDGWRAFLGGFKEDEALRQFEASLDQYVPSPDKIAVPPQRWPTLIKEFQKFLADCNWFSGYRPMKFVWRSDNDRDNLQEGDG